MNQNELLSGLLGRYGDRAVGISSKRDVPGGISEFPEAFRFLLGRISVNYAEASIGVGVQHQLSGTGE